MAFGGGLEQTSTYQAAPRDLVDFEVTDIELGNNSRQAMDWTNPDGSMVEYVMRDELIQINVTFTQVGTSGQPASAVGTLQIWHRLQIDPEFYFWFRNLSASQKWSDFH